MLLQHSVLYILARGFPGLINFAALAIYTRLLTSEEYGRYALVVATVGLANAALFQWLHLGLLRYLARYGQHKADFFSTVAAGYLVVTLLSAIGWGVLLDFWPETGERLLISLGVLFLWAQALFDLNLQIAASQLTPQRYGLLAITKALASLAGGGILAWWGLGASGLLLGLIGGFLLPVVLWAPQEWRYLSAYSVDKRLMQQLLSYGLPLTATFALLFVVNSSDRLLLGWIEGTQAAGLYAVGYDLPNQILWVLMTVVHLAAYPLAVHALEREGQGAVQVQLQKNAVALLSIALPATVALVFLGPNIAQVVLGAEFRKAAEMLIGWVAIATLLAGAKTYYFDLAFQLGQYTMGQVWIAFITAAVNLLLNLWLIPQFSITGAAYATVCAYLIGLTLSIRLGRNYFHLPIPISEGVKILGATTLMGLVLWFFLPLAGLAGLSIQVLAGTVSYGLVILLFNVASSRSRFFLFFNRFFPLLR
jgi:O-antigen/teichoic acid export membrane protein